jgi:CBS domain-containing protein
MKPPSSSLELRRSHAKGLANTPRVVSEHVITATRSTTAAVVATMMRAHRVGCVVVVEDGRPIGIVTDRDLALRVVADSLPGHTLVEDVMTPDPVTARATAGIETMLRVLRKAGTRRLPLVDDAGHLVGIVTHDDLLRLHSRELEALGAAVEDEVDATELR